MALRNIIIFFFLAGSLQAYSQKSGILHGLVKNRDSVVENVVVRNISNDRLTTTDSDGIFSLPVKQGDTLVFSHMSLRDLIVFIEEDDLNSDPLLLRMVEVENELDEVVLKDYSEINAVSLGIIPKKIERPSLNERRLRTAGDFKWIHLLGILGGSLQIDPILNAINGRTKKLKRNIKIEKKIENINFLKDNYSEYMIVTMGLSDQEIGQLVSFAVEDVNLQKLINDKNDARIKFFLHDAWIKFKKVAEGTSSP